MARAAVTAIHAQQEKPAGPGTALVRRLQTEQRARLSDATAHAAAACAAT